MLESLRTKVLSVLSHAYGGEHHIPGEIHDKGHFLEINVLHGLATWDFRTLTLLVLACHHFCVRMEVEGGGPRRLKLRFHDRQREARQAWARHPDLDELMDQINEMKLHFETSSEAARAEASGPRE